MRKYNDPELDALLAKVAEDISNEVEIGKLADILVEGFIWLHEHKDDISQPYTPKPRKKKSKGEGLFRDHYYL
jgi:hypothetical protein